jgi:UDP-3-O-[3-hydroxymyristoyl] glucosamine N-acyltransferase
MPTAPPPDREDNMELTAQDIATIVEGNVHGNPREKVTGMADLPDAGPQDVACLTAADDEAARATGAGVLVAREQPEGYEGTFVSCPDPSLALVRLLEQFAGDRYTPPVGISPQAVVAQDAEIGRNVAIGASAVICSGARVGDDVTIYPGVYVGPNCRIGRGTVIYANCSLHDDTRVGDDCILHYGCAVGADGFGFHQHEGRHLKRHHLGTVEIGDRVELGALSTVDRGMLGPTVIEEGFKCDNHVHIGHNCRIGPHCLLTAGCLVGGSTELEAHVMAAADCVFKDHIKVAEGTRVAARAALAHDSEPGSVLAGGPAREFRHQMRIYAAIDKLPEMSRKVRKLEKMVEDLTSQLNKQQD